MSLRYTSHVFQLNLAEILNISLSNTSGELQSPKANTVNCQSPLPGKVKDVLDRSSGATET